MMTMMLQRSQSESTFSRRPNQLPPNHSASANTSIDNARPSMDHRDPQLSSTPSLRAPPGRTSSTTPRRSASTSQTNAPAPDQASLSTPSSSSTSRLPGRQTSVKSTTASCDDRQQPQNQALLRSKTASQQTVLSGGSSTTAFSRTAWASEESMDKKGRRDRKASSSSKSKRRLMLPPSPSDDGDHKYETMWTIGKDSPPSPRAKSPKQEEPFAPSSKADKNSTDYCDGPRSPSSKPSSANKRLGSSSSNTRRYHPHNEKFAIPSSPSPRQIVAPRSPLRDSVFNHSPLTQSKSAPSFRDERFVSNLSNGHARQDLPCGGRKPSQEIVLEFSEKGTPSRPSQQLNKSGREDVGSRVNRHHVIRAAQSVPRLDGEQAYTTPTNSPDRSTRPRSADTRAQENKKPRNKTCDFFYFFRWGKKKNKGANKFLGSEDEDEEEERERDRRRHRKSKSGRSSSPDKHERGRLGQSPDRYSRRYVQPDKGRDHHHRERMSSSSASRPLRTPTGTSSAKRTDAASTPASKGSDHHQPREYRHNHRRQHHQQEQQHQPRKHHRRHRREEGSPDENRPAYTPTRRKRERPSRSHQQKQGLRTNTEDGRSLVSDVTMGLRHEDLPPHPSIAKSMTPKGAGVKAAPPISGAYLKNTFVRAPGTPSGADPFRRGRFRSRSESPSNLRPGAASSGSNLDLAGSGDVGGDSSGGLGRDVSQPSATSRTDLDSTTHYMTASSTDVRHHRSRSPSPRSSPVNNLGRSKSFHGFESGQHMRYFNPEADTKVITDAEDFEYRPTDMSGPLHLSFCGCGFVGMYHLGVVACLLQRAPEFLSRVQNVAGASGGALLAAVLLCVPDKLEEVAELLQNLAHELRSRPLGALTPGYSFARSLRHMLDDLLPEDAHLQASGRLHISLTASASSSSSSGGAGGEGGEGGGKKKRKNNELMSEFESREELIEALVATSYIPLYSGFKMPVIRGKKYMDGGFSDNMPRFATGRTITVSPFDGRSDISPKAGQEAKKAHFINVHNQEYQLNVRNMKKSAHAYFPPKRHVMQEYFDLGRYDASRFLIREGLYTIQLVYNSEKAVYVSSV